MYSEHAQDARGGIDKMRDTGKWILALAAARAADCHPTYFNFVVNKGEMKSKRIAGRVFVERDSFDAWLELYRVRRHRTTATSTHAMA